MRWISIAFVFCAVPALGDGRALRPAPQEPGFLIQLGAEHSEAEAAHSWLVIAARAGGVLDGLKPEITPVKLPRKARLWRLRAGPIDPAGAASICGQLKARSIDCIVVH